jgi:hypothetical protein
MSQTLTLVQIGKIVRAYKTSTPERRSLMTFDALIARLRTPVGGLPKRGGKMKHGFDVKTAEEAEWLLDYLSVQFKCTKPSLEFNAIATEYDYATGTIHVCLGVWISPRLTDALLRRFAEHLTREPGNDFLYARNLVRVVKAWRGYARRNEYTWAMEPESVRRWLPLFNQRKTTSKAREK